MSACGADIFAAVETHLSNEKVGAAAAKIHEAGWRPHFAPACTAISETSAGATGTQGGVMFANRLPLMYNQLEEASAEGCAWRSPLHHCAGAHIQLKGLSILLFAAYHRDQVQQHMLTELSQATSQGDVPFVCIADWNTPPDEWNIKGRSQWLHSNKATLVIPSQGDRTCKDRLIDYIVCSRALAPPSLQHATSHGQSPGHLTAPFA